MVELLEISCLIYPAEELHPPNERLNAEEFRISSLYAFALKCIKYPARLQRNEYSGV
jgi:SUMO ligase MMS21 Smc5/6 complex component